MCDLTVSDINSWYYGNDYAYTLPFLAFSGSQYSVFKMYMKDKPTIEKVADLPASIASY